MFIRKCLQFLLLLVVISPIATSVGHGRRGKHSHRYCHSHSLSGPSHIGDVNTATTISTASDSSTHSISGTTRPTPSAAPGSNVPSAASEHPTLSSTYMLPSASIPAVPNSSVTTVPSPPIAHSPLTPNGIKAGIAGGDAYPFLEAHIGWWYDWYTCCIPYYD